MLVKSARSAPFVSFNATDLKQVTLARDTLRGRRPWLLRFGFAVGVKPARRALVEVRTQLPAPAPGPAHPAHPAMQQDTDSWAPTFVR